MQITLTELWHHMGLFARLIVGVLAVMSMLSLFAAGERYLTLRKAKKQSLEFARQMGRRFAQDGIDAAASIEMSPNPGYLGRVIVQGLEAYRSTRGADPDLIFESVSRALERQGQREVQGMKRGQGILGTVSSTAPFVGLLGTVMGIVNSFR
jgi:biopolymer transport protein TolQ